MDEAWISELRPPSFTLPAATTASGIYLGSLDPSIVLRHVPWLSAGQEGACAMSDCDLKNVS